MPSPLTVLVAGCGSIGRRHAANLLALGQRVVAHDPDGERRAAVERDLGVATFATLEEALAGSPQLTLVCAPPSCHLGVARQALAAGSHLFIEKPISASLEGVPALLSDAERAGRQVLIGYNLRFHPGLAVVREAVRAGRVGRALSARAEFGSYLPDWRPTQDYRTGYAAHAHLGGGVVLDAIHEIDALVWTLGPVRRVTAFTASTGTLAIETEDLAAMLLEMECGALGEVHVDYLQRSYCRSLKVVGSEGTAQWDHAAAAAWLECAGSRDREPLWDGRGYDIRATYREELAAVLARLAGQAAAPLATGREGLDTLAVALAARESAARGAAVGPRATGDRA
jgi:predicted dehydrogenase